MSETTRPPGIHEPGVRNYLFLGLCGLLMLFLGLLTRGHDTWSLFPVLIGLLMLLTRWQVGPLVLLVVITGMFFFPGLGAPYRSPMLGTPRLADVVICLGVLAYVAGHYRLQGLFADPFPKESSRPPPRRLLDRGPLPLQGQPRSAKRASANEIIMLLASLPLWVGLALAIYPWLVPANEVLDRGTVLRSHALEMLIEAILRCRLVVLVFGIVVLTLAAVFRYLAWQRWSLTEARLVLQDTVWSQTRAEERRINTWQRWARWRRKGGP